MQLVRQNEKHTYIRHWGTTARGAAVLILIGVVGSACTQPPDRTPRGRSGPGAGQGQRALLGTARAPDATYALEGKARGNRTGRKGARYGAYDNLRNNPPATARGLAGAPARGPARAPAPGPVRDTARAPAAWEIAGGEGSHGAPALGLNSAPARALALYSSELAKAEAARTAVARSWGLARAPLVPPAPPAVKPRLTSSRGPSMGRGLPPVITRVPTRDRVVFLTIDDGAEKDPWLIRMLRELDLPVSAFLTDYVVRDDYDYFRELQSLGVAMNNHTVNHRNLRALPYADQQREICRQQDTMEREFGVRPRIFRPPYGNYNRDTLRAAQSCGIAVVPLWTEEAFPGRMDFSGERRLHSGDIILTHFRGRAQWGGTMPDVIRRVVRMATEQGFAVARLEDYV